MEFDKIHALIRQVLSETKLAKNKFIEAKIYADSPILRPASQMPGYLPERYVKMRALAGSHDGIPDSAEQVFAVQAAFMADFEDRFDYHGTVTRYYPTYMSFSDEQLRGYFSWRTRVRHGTVEQTSLSFVYLYLYELLGCYGFDSPQAAFDALKWIWSRYRTIDASIDGYAKSWMKDFVVFYQLDRACLSDVYDFSYDDALPVLIDYRESGDGDLFDALCVFSSYHLRGSALYKAYPEDCAAVCVRAFRLYADYYETHNKSSLCESLFGQYTASSYTIFGSAVFRGRTKHADGVYTLGKYHRYLCKRGCWMQEKYFGAGKKNAKLGCLMKAADARLRREFGFSPPLTPGKETKIMQSMIEKALAAWLQEKKAAQARERALRFDFSRLSEIRSSSEKLRERLTVAEDSAYVPAQDLIPEEQAEKEAASAVPPVALPPAAAAAAAESAAPDDSLLMLDETERTFLSLLLTGGDAAALQFLSQRHIMPSVAVDRINEKLYDAFSDTVIECGDDAVRVVDDYREALLSLVCKKTSAGGADGE